jgi:hypothetical protein
MAFEDFEMKRQAERSDRNLKSFDVRDRLILALYAQLKAERQTREAMEWVIRNGGLSPEVLEAIASDPVPVLAEADVPAIERILAGDRRRERPSRSDHEGRRS